MQSNHVPSPSLSGTLLPHVVIPLSTSRDRHNLMQPRSYEATNISTPIKLKARAMARSTINEVTESKETLPMDSIIQEPQYAHFQDTVNQSCYSIRNELFMKTKRSSMANSSRLGVHRDTESATRNADLNGVVSPNASIKRRPGRRSLGGQEANGRNMGPQSQAIEQYRHDLKMTLANELYLEEQQNLQQQKEQQRQYLPSLRLQNRLGIEQSPGQRDGRQIKQVRQKNIRFAGAKASNNNSPAAFFNNMEIARNFQNELQTTQTKGMLKVQGDFGTPTPAQQPIDLNAISECHQNANLIHQMKTPTQHFVQSGSKMSMLQGANAGGNAKAMSTGAPATIAATLIARRHAATMSKGAPSLKKDLTPPLQSSQSPAQQILQNLRQQRQGNNQVTKIKNQEQNAQQPQKGTKKQEMTYKIKKLSNSLEGTLHAITQSRSQMEPSVSIVNQTGQEDLNENPGDLREKLIKLLKDKFDNEHVNILPQNAQIDYRNQNLLSAPDTSTLSQSSNSPGGIGPKGWTASLLLVDSNNSQQNNTSKGLDSPTKRQRKEENETKFSQRALLEYIDKQVSSKSSNNHQVKSPNQRFLSPLAGAGQAFDQRKKRKSHQQYSMLLNPELGEMGTYPTELTLMDQTIENAQKQHQRGGKAQGRKDQNQIIWNKSEIEKNNQQLHQDQRQIQNSLTMKTMDIQGPNMFDMKLRNEMNKGMPIQPTAQFELLRKRDQYSYRIQQQLKLQGAISGNGQELKPGWNKNTQLQKNKANGDRASSRLRKNNNNLDLQPVESKESVSAESERRLEDPDPEKAKHKDKDQKEEAAGAEQDVVPENQAQRLSRLISDKQVIEQNLKDYKPFGDKWTKNHEDTTSPGEEISSPGSPQKSEVNQSENEQNEKSPIVDARLPNQESREMLDNQLKETQEEQSLEVDDSDHTPNEKIRKPSPLKQPLQKDEKPPKFQPSKGLEFNGLEASSPASPGQENRIKKLQINVLESNILEQMNQQKSLIRVQIEHHQSYQKGGGKGGIGQHIQSSISQQYKSNNIQYKHQMNLKRGSKQAYKDKEPLLDVTGISGAKSPPTILRQQSQQLAALYEKKAIRVQDVEMVPQTQGIEIDLQRLQRGAAKNNQHADKSIKVIIPQQPFKQVIESQRELHKKKNVTLRGNNSTLRYFKLDENISGRSSRLLEAGNASNPDDELQTIYSVEQSKHNDGEHRQLPLQHHIGESTLSNHDHAPGQALAAMNQDLPALTAHIIPRMVETRAVNEHPDANTANLRQAIPAYQTSVEPKQSPSATKHSSAYAAILQEARPPRNSQAHQTPQSNLRNFQLRKPVLLKKKRPSKNLNQNHNSSIIRGPSSHDVLANANATAQSQAPRQAQPAQATAQQSPTEATQGAPQKPVKRGALLLPPAKLGLPEFVKRLEQRESPKLLAREPDQRAAGRHGNASPAREGSAKMILAQKISRHNLTLDISPFDSSYTGKKGFRGIEVFNQIGEWEHPKEGSPSPGLPQLSASPGEATRDVPRHLDLSAALGQSLEAGTARLSEAQDQSPTRGGPGRGRLVKNDPNDLMYSSEAVPEPRRGNGGIISPIHSSPDTSPQNSKSSVVFNVNSTVTRSYAASRRAEEPIAQGTDGIPEEGVGYDDSVQILVESDRSSTDSRRKRPEGLVLVKIQDDLHDKIGAKD